MKMQVRVIAILLLAVPCISRGGQAVQFSGYDWEIRPSAQDGGPGPNRWDEKNVWVDAAGRLHLKLTQRDGKWYCAEIYTKKAFGFGIYQFWITGRLDKLDQNVVFGLFNYPEPDLGPDGTNEIDIEYARWRRPGAPVCNFTAYPVVQNLKGAEKNFPATLRKEASSTQRFTWTSRQILFQSLHGHTDAEGDAIASWLYHPADADQRIAQKPMPVHINLWCCDGYPPKDRKEVEIVVDSFKFTPK